MIIFNPATIIRSAELNANFNELESKTDWLTEPDGDWITPTLLNSWTNYNATHEVAGYYKDACGIVHLRGLIKNGTLNTNIWQFPAGYRPKDNGNNQKIILACLSNAAAGRLDLWPDGNFRADSPSSNAWISLDGITFRAEE